MIPETASVWAFSALGFSFVYFVVYQFIFFGIFYLVGWAVAQVIRPVLTLVTYE